jgi:hydrogenase maturation protease
MTQTAGPTVILGVGNELYRDDGVGVVVARALAADHLPPEVTVVEGHVGGINLLFEMEGASRVILIDAVQMDLAPGTVRVFRPDEVSTIQLQNMASLHQVGLGHVLELGRLLGLTDHIHIVGIQPLEVAAGLSLTPTVAQAVPEAVAAVKRLLADSDAECQS